MKALVRLWIPVMLDRVHHHPHLIRQGCRRRRLATFSLNISVCLILKAAQGLQIIRGMRNNLGHNKVITTLMTLIILRRFFD